MPDEPRVPEDLRELDLEVGRVGEHLSRSVEAHPAAAPPATERTVLRPYEPEHVKAQRLMAQVADPYTGRPMTRSRVAELCGIDRGTLWRWINDETRGGKRAWNEAVGRFVSEYLEGDWPLLVRVQRDEALAGKAKVGAFRNVARVLGKLGPEVVVESPTVQVEANVHAQIVVQVPDNGRSRETNPLGAGFRRVIEVGGPEGGNGDGDGAGRGEGGE